MHNGRQRNDVNHDEEDEDDVDNLRSMLARLHPMDYVKEKKGIREGKNIRKCEHKFLRFMFSTVITFITYLTSRDEDEV